MDKQTIILADAGETCAVFTHKSGLKVFLTEKDLHTSYAVIGVRFGSFYEKCRVNGGILDLPDGTAHFLEHKMFENEDGEDTFVKFSAYGASANAYTGYDQTCYLFSTPERPEKPLEVLLDTVFRPYFTQKSVNREKGIIIEELKMYRDDPSERIGSAVNRRMYDHHRITRDVVGSVGSVRSVTPEHLYTAHRLFYIPSNAVLSLCGRFDRAAVERILDERLPARGGEAPRVEPLEAEEAPDVCRPCGKTIKRDIPLPTAVIGLKCPKAEGGSPERLKRFNEMSVLAHELFSESSPFISELKKDRLLLADPSYDVTHSRFFSRILFYAASEDPSAVLDRFGRRAEELRANGVAKENLLRCQKMLWAEFLDSFNSSEGCATRYLSDALEHLNTEETGQSIFSLTVEDLRKTANELLAPARILRLAVYPEAAKKGETK